MDAKKFNRYVFITSLGIALFSIIGLILLGTTYLKVDVMYLGEKMDSYAYSGYQLIFDQVVIKASFEPLLHLIGFVFFLLGSLIFIIIEINNKFGKKKVDLGIKTNLNKKSLTIIQVICSVILVAIAVLIIVYGFLVVPVESANNVYSIGASKTINAFLLGADVLVLTASMNLVLNLAKK